MGTAAGLPARSGSEGAAAASAAAPISFDAFFTLEFPKMVVLATALTGDPALAEELAQEALLRTYRHWEKVSGYERPGAWTRRVTMNLASTARTRRRAEGAALERLAGATAGAANDDLRLSAEFWNLVRQLPRRQRAAVALYYLEDRSVADVAAA